MPTIDCVPVGAIVSHAPTGVRGKVILVPVIAPLDGGYWDLAAGSEVTVEEGIKVTFEYPNMGRLEFPPIGATVKLLEGKEGNVGLHTVKKYDPQRQGYVDRTDLDFRPIAAGMSGVIQSYGRADAPSRYRAERSFLTLRFGEDDGQRVTFWGPVELEVVSIPPSPPSPSS